MLRKHCKALISCAHLMDSPVSVKVWRYSHRWNFAVQTPSQVTVRGMIRKELFLALRPGWYLKNHVLHMMKIAWWITVDRLIEHMESSSHIWKNYCFIKHVSGLVHLRSERVVQFDTVWISSEDILSFTAVACTRFSLAAQTKMRRNKALENEWTIVSWSKCIGFHISQVNLW